MRKTSHFVFVIAALMGVAVGLQVRRDRGWKAYDPPSPVLWLQNPSFMQRAALSHHALVADIYWIRAVVYFGRQRLSTAKDKTYDLLYPFLNFVTSLDSRFMVAYRFGAVFLSEPYPAGPGRPDQAIELLRRATEQNPDRWEYPHDLGFVYYWSYRDYTKAAEWFERGSHIPGAPFWLKTTAATALAQGGDRESSRLIWRQLYETAELSWLKQAAEVRLAQLDALDAIDTLNLIVWRYKARTGRFPVSWQELVNARVLRGIPVDPTGVPFVLDLSNEDVRVSQKSLVWPLPEGLESSQP